MINTAKKFMFRLEQKLAVKIKTHIILERQGIST